MALRQDRKNPLGLAQLGKALPMWTIHPDSWELPASTLTLAGYRKHVPENLLIASGLLTIADHVPSPQDFFSPLFSDKLQKTWPCFLIYNTEIIIVPPSLSYCKNSNENICKTFSCTAWPIVNTQYALVTLFLFTIVMFTIITTVISISS